MTEPASKIIPIPLGFVSCFLIKGERCILVDTGIPGSTDKIFNTLSSTGIDPQDISLIILTHVHVDHFGCVKQIKEKTGAKVAVQANAAEKLRQGETEDVVGTSFIARLLINIMSKRIPKDIPGVTPEVIINDELSLQEYGVKGKVMSTPGHTDGSVSVILDNGEVIVGDMIRGGLISKNTPGIPPFVVNIQQLKESINKILDLKPTKLYASHGGPFNPEDVRNKIGNKI
jgi:glyoxylase-like metal-dependent hydrolase (beta-lactamase superfamily II)